MIAVPLLLPRNPDEWAAIGTLKYAIRTAVLLTQDRFPPDRTAEADIETLNAVMRRIRKDNHQW